MLNELYVISQAVKDKGLLQITQHRDINSPANNSGIGIEIDNKGLPRNIEYIPKDKFVKLWKHSKGNHNSFPIIRVQKPFINHDLTEAFEKSWNKIRNNEEKIQILSRLNYKDYNLDSNDIIISDWTREQLLPVCKDCIELKSLESLICTLPQNKNEQINFYLCLLELIKSQLTTFEEPLLDLIKLILLGKKVKGQTNFLSGVQIAFDIYDSSRFKFKIRDQRLKNVLINELNKIDAIQNKNARVGECQLSGITQIIETEKYPGPKLPNLGTTYLYSNNKDIHCLDRYGLNSLQAFKVGKNSIAEMNNALNFITQPEREYKTWVKLPGSKEKELNLLIAYVEDEPERDDELAQLLGDAPNYDQDTLRFETLCEQVCKKLKEKTEQKPDSKIKIVIINKVDDGRKQVVLSENYKADDIIIGSNQWQVASGNSPNIEYHIWKNGKEIKISTFCPYPGQIINFSKKYWKWERTNSKQDLKNEKKPGITLKEFYDVFLPNLHNRESYRKLLQQICIQSQDLLISVGHVYNRKKISEINIASIYDHCLAVSLLSILLYKLNIFKEDYMHSVAFNIGRLMMLSDVVHREYCLNVNPQKGSTKSGKVPPQLIGNSLMPTAAEFPNRALDLLRERIKIYKAWADTVDANDNTKIAKWAINQIGNVALEMSMQEIPESFDEVERAQVLLGYLAKIEKEEK